MTATNSVAALPQAPDQTSPNTNAEPGPMIATLTRGLDGLQTLMDLGHMIVQAQSVVVYRMTGLFGGWTVDADENHRMVSEKPIAFLEANLSAVTAMLAGKGADHVTRAWIEPLSEQVHSNRTRLEQKGPAIFGAQVKQPG